MSASEDLQSAVQPAASEALEGFPLSPLQTRAWRRHAERPENTVVGVRLHAPADPAATLEGCAGRWTARRNCAWLTGRCRA
ncbi:hypothetical protein P4200_01040 [Pseudomonas aeruginosa]|nr:hypothetical protein [Pseudomonas aeruginosa]